ncbi:V-type ATP synthase subunit D [Candidatus Micrarchaeota archaeon]|nr:V-type ATP synthase subunit D [Candidatus Micrarchaeota archaeon]MBI5176564.1 V-type ATP synthase subunit D [Candidatus Micrarchaeota archaeon]
MPEVSPTRMELLNTRQKLSMAEKGHKLLKQKRDALVLEFFNAVKKAKDLRQQLNTAVVDAQKKLAIARSIHGDLFVESSALSATKIPEIRVEAKNIMGVKIPQIEATDVRRNLLDRGYSVLGSSAQFDAAVEAFENSLNLSVQLAETETAIKRLLREIEKTNRRVNALEYNVQPSLREIVRFIQDSLNRLESERFFALKLTKARLQAAAEAEAMASAA